MKTRPSVSRGRGVSTDHTECVVLLRIAPSRRVNAYLHEGEARGESLACLDEAQQGIPGRSTRTWDGREGDRADRWCAWT